MKSLKNILAIATTGLMLASFSGCSMDPSDEGEVKSAKVGENMEFRRGDAYTYRYAGLSSKDFFSITKLPSQHQAWNEYFPVNNSHVYCYEILEVNPSEIKYRRVE